MRIGHGDDIHNRDVEIVSNFSTNIMCKQSLSLERYLASRLSMIYNYPDCECRKLCGLIADYEKIRHECIGITSGAVEAIYLIARTFDKSVSKILTPTFQEYEDACRANAHKVSFSPVGLPDITEDTHIVWLCNPNNPDGSMIPRDSLLDMLQRHKDVIFVIDQAYEDYTALEGLTGMDVCNHKNVIILKSLTKKFSIPGLRVGYFITNPDLRDRIMSHQLPWAVNAIAIEAAMYCFTHPDEFRINVRFLWYERDFLADSFRKIGIKVSESSTNFILCCLPKGSASELKHYLLNKHSILIRDASNFHGLTSQHFRVSALSHEENVNLVNAIKTWLISL